jgi:hypothetical protein
VGYVGHVWAEARQSLAHKYAPVSASLSKITSHAVNININMQSSTSGPPSPLSDPLGFITYLLTPYTEFERASLERAKWFNSLGNGYEIQQSTQPQTLGYSLADSPVGLLAWIYEKLVNWTDVYPWTDDEGKSR